MSMRCPYCGTELQRDDCTAYESSVPVDSIRVQAYGDTDDPWASREYRHYDARITFADGTTFEADLTFPSEKDGVDRGIHRRFAKNLNRNNWEVVDETPNGVVYEIPNPFYSMKVVDRGDSYMIRANAVDPDPDPDETHHDVYTGGRANLILSEADGDRLLADHADKFARGSTGGTPRPWDRHTDDDREWNDWVYARKPEDGEYESHRVARS